jgi:hypothetical protein
LGFASQPILLFLPFAVAGSKKMVDDSCHIAENKGKPNPTR